MQLAIWGKLEQGGFVGMNRVAALLQHADGEVVAACHQVVGERTADGDALCQQR
ncbi:hypothetical protein D3C86_2220420 [compost metagenome]